jgi:hypothetical protein
VVQILKLWAFDTRLKEFVMREWHRYLFLLLRDYLDGTRHTVESEYDVSQQQQKLDILIIRREEKTGDLPDSERPMPDGFALGEHTLISFKSFQETLDDWAILELIHHYVAYRKLASPNPKRLLPEDDFVLIAFTARLPENLRQQFPLEEISEGVYNLRVLSLNIRIVVANSLPETEENAMLQLFSASRNIVLNAQRRYRRKSQTTSGLLNELLTLYQDEELMKTIAEELQEIDERVAMRVLPKIFPKILPQLLPQVPTQQILDLVPHDQLLKGLTTEERLKDVPMEDRLKDVPIEERLKNVSAEDLMKGISPETLKAIMEKMQSEQEKPES